MRRHPALLALVGVAGCGEARAPGSAGEPVVRDSAGVQIVENAAPLWQNSEQA